jgi:hypothetical protein
MNTSEALAATAKLGTHSVIKALENANALVLRLIFGSDDDDTSLLGPSMGCIATLVPKHRPETGVAMPLSAYRSSEVRKLVQAQDSWLVEQSCHELNNLSNAIRITTRVRLDTTDPLQIGRLAVLVAQFDLSNGPVLRSCTLCFEEPVGANSPLSVVTLAPRSH